MSHLDRGEVAAITLAATHPGALLLVDDLAGRRAATELGIEVLGTLGVLIAAKRRGKLSAIEPVLRQLVDGGLWLAPALIEAVLAKVGEAGGQGRS